jgi:hypothetical protein
MESARLRGYRSPSYNMTAKVIHVFITLELDLSPMQEEHHDILSGQFNCLQRVRMDR